MGTYTNLAMLSGPVRRPRPLGRARSTAERRPLDLLEHRCPRCGDSSVVPTECVRCQAPPRERLAIGLATLVTALTFWIPVVGGEVAILSRMDSHLSFVLRSQAPMICAHNAWLLAGALAIAGISLLLYAAAGRGWSRALARRLSRSG